MRKVRIKCSRFGSIYETRGQYTVIVLIFVPYSSFFVPPLPPPGGRILIRTKFSTVFSLGDLFKCIFLGLWYRRPCITTVNKFTLRTQRSRYIQIPYFFGHSTARGRILIRTNIKTCKIWPGGSKYSTDEY